MDKIFPFFLKYYFKKVLMLVMDIYVIGHKNPDTDSVVSAIAAAELMGYKPAVSGPVNKETNFVLSSFGVRIPEIISDIAGKKIFLVDHNESGQMVSGWEKAVIVGVIDHHKINFSSSEPVFFHAEVLGSTSSLIAKIYMEKIAVNPLLAKLLLAGILSDTIVFKSPTVTEEDKIIANKLAYIGGVKDIIQWGTEIKKAGADITGRSIKDIIQADFKDFNICGKKIGVGQVELADISILEKSEQEILACLREIKNNGYELVIMAITDILNEGSKLLFVGPEEIIKKSFPDFPLSENKIFVKGLMSRKKQIIPPVEAVLSGNN